MPVWYIFNAQWLLNFLFSLSEGLRVPAGPEHQVARGLAPAVLDGVQAPPGVGHEVLERGVQGQRPALLVQPDEKLWKLDESLLFP